MTEILKTIAGVPVANTQDVQNAAADKASYYFDGNDDAVNTSQVSSLQLSGDFSFLANVFVKSYAATLTTRAFSIVAVGNNGIIIGITTTGFLTYTTMAAGTTTNEIVTNISVPINKWFSIVCTRQGSAITFFINGVLSAFGSSSTMLTFAAVTGVNINWNDTLLGFVGSVSRAALFNYAINTLSEEKIKRYSAGTKLDFEDVGGSMTDLSSGLVWVKINYTTFTPDGSSKNITSAIGSINQYARIGFVNSPNGSLIPIVSGKKYRMYYTLTSTGATLPSVVFMTGTDSVISSDSVVLPIVTNGYVDITATVTNNACLRIFNATGNVDFSFTFNSLVQLGAVLDLEPEGIVGGTTPVWLDSSPNALHGAVAGALPTNTKAEVIDLLKTQNFTASQTDGNVGTSFTLPSGLYLFCGKGAFDSNNATTTVAAGGFLRFEVVTGVTMLSVAQLAVNQVQGGVDALDLPLLALVRSTGQSLQCKATFTLSGSSFNVDTYVVGKFIKLA